MNKKIMIRFLCAFGVAFMIILFADHTEEYTGQKELSGNKRVEDIQKPKIKKGKELHTHSTVDWEKCIATIYWKPVENISKYKIVSYIDEERKEGEERESEEIEEKDITLEDITVEDITEEGELFYAHQIVYGASYEYELRLYREVEGKEQWVTTEPYYLDIKPAELDLQAEREETEEDVRLTISLISSWGDLDALPTGVQIFRGTNREEMRLIDTVMWDELQDRQYTDKQNSYAVSYQVQSFVDTGGERHYGEKSRILRFLAPEAYQDMDVKINMANKSQIDKMEIVLTNQSGQPIYAGMPYIKNYNYARLPYHYENYNKEHGDHYAFMFFDGMDEYEYPIPPICSSAELQIDEISYKFHQSDRYQILSRKDSITIKPGETIYLCFARKDHKKFKNFFKDGSADRMCIYLFQYLGEKVFLCVRKYDNDSYMGWGRDDEPDMRTWDSWLASW